MTRPCAWSNYLPIFASQAWYSCRLPMVQMCGAWGYLQVQPVTPDRIRR